MKDLFKMKSFILGLILGLIISASVVWAEEQLSAVMHGIIIINVDVGTQYEQTIKILHGNEEIKMTPLELWRRATLSKKRM